jgi:hypothetical protein
MNAAVSSDESSGTGSRIPITAHQRPPIQTIGDPASDSMPNRRAAVAPSTTAGNDSVDESRNRPSATDAPTVVNNDDVAAVTAMPPVSEAGIRSVRRTVTLDSPAVALTSSTGPILRIIDGASSGNLESSPNSV